MADLIPMRTIPSILFTCIVYFMLGKYSLLQSHYNPLNKPTRHSHFIYVHVYRYIYIDKALHQHGSGY